MTELRDYRQGLGPFPPAETIQVLPAAFKKSRHSIWPRALNPVCNISVVLTFQDPNCQKLPMDSLSTGKCGMSPIICSFLANQIRVHYATHWNKEHKGKRDSHGQRAFLSYSTRGYFSSKVQCVLPSVSLSLQDYIMAWTAAKSSGKNLPMPFLLPTQLWGPTMGDLEDKRSKRNIVWLYIICPCFICPVWFSVWDKYVCDFNEIIQWKWDTLQRCCYWSNNGPQTNPVVL